jgi:hypothetical protein
MKINTIIKIVITDVDGVKKIVHEPTVIDIDKEAFNNTIKRHEKKLNKKIVNAELCVNYNVELIEKDK